jgi:hypothetical protein
MAVNPATIAAYAPHGNAELAFKVETSTGSINPSTGNYVAQTVELEYLATLTLQRPDWRAAPGADQATYGVTGRLLSPSTLDPRITNGSQAVARINGVIGRLELIFDMDQPVCPDLRQVIQGTFRVTGGG